MLSGDSRAVLDEDDGDDDDTFLTTSVKNDINPAMKEED